MADSVARSLTIAGIAGRYRSVDSGATPDISANAISVGAARLLAVDPGSLKLAPDPSALKRDCVVSAPSGDDTDLRECVT